MRGRQQLSRVLAVDPSLSASGWAFFALTGKLLAAGVLSPPGPQMGLEQRLLILQKKVRSLYENLELTGSDFLVCEGPAPLVKDPISSMKLEQVRSMFEVLARERGACVPGRLNPRTIQTELLSLSGKQLARVEVKRAAREVAQKLYQSQFGQLMVRRKRTSAIPQDIVDALLIGTLAVSRLETALKIKLDPYSAFLGRNGRARTKR